MQDIWTYASALVPAELSVLTFPIHPPEDEVDQVLSGVSNNGRQFLDVLVVSYAWHEHSKSELLANVPEEKVTFE